MVLDIKVNKQVYYTLLVISEAIFPANHLTGAKPGLPNQLFG